MGSATYLLSNGSTARYSQNAVNRQATFGLTLVVVVVVVVVVDVVIVVVVVLYGFGFRICVIEGSYIKLIRRRFPHSRFLPNSFCFPYLDGPTCRKLFFSADQLTCYTFK